MESLIRTAGMIETLSFANGLASQYIKLRNIIVLFLLKVANFGAGVKLRFDAQGRVDTTLMSNLRIMRRTLINQISKRCNESKEAISRVVHALLSRSIFVKYLEERGKIFKWQNSIPRGLLFKFCGVSKTIYRYFDQQRSDL